MDLDLSPTTVIILISVVIPFVTGLLTKLEASTTLKQCVTIVLTAANALIVTATMADGTAVLSQESLTNFAISTVIALLTYLGFMQPHNTNAKLAPGAGIGPAKNDPPPAD